jgi:hypothetical protein
MAEPSTPKKGKTSRGRPSPANPGVPKTRNVPSDKPTARSPAMWDRRAQSPRDGWLERTPDASQRPRPMRSWAGRGVGHRRTETSHRLATAREARGVLAQKRHERLKAAPM